MSAAVEIVDEGSAEEWLAWLRIERNGHGPADVGMRDCADALEAEINRLRAKLARIRAQRHELLRQE